MDLLLKCTSSGLIPIYDDDYDNKRKLKIGETYKAKISVPRNGREHRKYFALINCAWEYLNEKHRDEFLNNIECFRDALQVLVGHVETRRSIAEGSYYLASKSVNYDSMNGVEFLDLYKRVRDILFHTYLSDISMEDFEKSFKNFYND